MRQRRKMDKVRGCYRTASLWFVVVLIGFSLLRAIS
jgi:hypothetical protein